MNNCFYLKQSNWEDIFEGHFEKMRMYTCIINKFKYIDIILKPQNK